MSPRRTVSRFLARMGRNGDARKRWLTFLQNHRDVIAAMDLFTVPTATFRVLYCFFVISHGRRRVLHFNVTKHPTSQWIVQQLREAFPEDFSPRYLILDQDAKFDEEVTEMIKSMSSKPIRTAYRSPWQNGVAECWVGSCRRELLDHEIVFNEAQHHGLAIVSNQPMDYRDGAKSWQYESTSLRHQLTGGSHPGGASRGVRLLVRALASTAAAQRAAVRCSSGHLANLLTSVW